MGPPHCRKSTIGLRFIFAAAIDENMQESCGGPPVPPNNLVPEGADNNLLITDKDLLLTDKDYGNDNAKKEGISCSTSGGEQSCVSLSSDGENGTSPANQQPSSSGYG